MKNFVWIALAASVFYCSCSKPSNPNAYSINGKAAGIEDGEIVVMTDSKGNEIARDTVINGEFAFSGIADSLMAVRIKTSNRNRTRVFIEPGSIFVDLTVKRAVGTQLNDDYYTFVNRLDSATKKRVSDTEYDYLEYVYSQELYATHPNDVLGLMAVNNIAYYLDFASLDSILKTAHPLIAKDENLNNALKAKEIEAATGAGSQYVDVSGIDANDESKTIALSDIIAKGKPVVVDFWASWCGPCRREIPIIAEYAKKYGDKVNFVGIAVWEDKISDTQEAMKALPINWPIIYAGGREKSPTKSYGIVGIPHIMLINSDGTILARGLHGEGIALAIESAIDKQ